MLRPRRLRLLKICQVRGIVSAGYAPTQNLGTLANSTTQAGLGCIDVLAKDCPVYFVRFSPWLLVLGLHDRAGRVPMLAAARGDPLAPVRPRQRRGGASADFPPATQTELPSTLKPTPLRLSWMVSDLRSGITNVKPASQQHAFPSTLRRWRRLADPIRVSHLVIPPKLLPDLSSAVPVPRGNRLPDRDNVHDLRR